ncbi:hypothetical protein FACS1894163_08670 [Spirochaetia bacterium]|nr:hypothetical protein FACS1894163_08670 [Spirochaetia bacterium]
MEKDKYQSDLLGSLHETAVGLHKIGVISDAEMQEYDNNCLVSEDDPTAGTTRSQTLTPAYAGQRK